LRSKPGGPVCDQCLYLKSAERSLWQLRSPTCGIISLLSAEFCCVAKALERQRHLHHFIASPHRFVAPGVRCLSRRDELQIETVCKGRRRRRKKKKKKIA